MRGVSLCSVAFLCIVPSRMFAFQQTRQLSSLKFGRMLPSTVTSQNLVKPPAFLSVQVASAGRLFSSGAQSSNTDLTKKQVPHSASKEWKINMLYDSDCRLCLIEINFMKKRDTEGKIKFTDLAELDYDPSQSGNIDFETGMKGMTAIFPDGRIIKGNEVFRETYKHIGLGWLWAITAWPVFGPIFDHLYDFWAKYRLAITGRPDLSQVIVERNEKIRLLKEQPCDDSGKCNF